MNKEQYEFLEKSILVQLCIDGIDVYITDMVVYDGKLHVKYFCKEKEYEELVESRVIECLNKLVENQQQLVEEQKQWKSRRRYSRILSTIKNFLGRLFRT